MIKNISYGDDTVLIANNVQGPQDIINSIVRHSEILRTSNQNNSLLKNANKHHLHFKGQIIEQITSLKYQGAYIISQCNRKTKYYQVMNKRGKHL